MPKFRRYLLGISGGRDSVALLHALMGAGFGKLVLCHMNHGLRGKASGQDAALVRRLAKKHGFPCEVTRKNMTASARENKQSMELAARNARHRFFAECSKKYHCNRLLLAHHADDQAETILFNLLRGSGGLKGVLFSSAHDIDGRTLSFFRPFLRVTRSEINGYLAENRIGYRDDTSNTKPVAVRNRLRNEAIPLLNEIMGREIRPALLRATRISESRDQALREPLNRLNLEDPQGRLFLPQIKQISPALRMIVFHDYLKKAAIGEISHDLLERCSHLLNDVSISKINLPGGRFLQRKEKRIFISS